VLSGSSETVMVYGNTKSFLSVSIVVVSVTLALAIVGCSQQLRPEQASAGERIATEDFLHEHLQQESAVTVAEAYRAAVMLLDGEDKFGAFEEREAYLMGLGVVRPSWHLQRDACIDRGSVAFMMLKIMGVRGGINLQTIGCLPLADRRYAYRELVYMEMVPLGPGYRFISGSELVSLMGKVDDYMAGHGMYPARTETMDQLLETQVSEHPSASMPRQ